jgi:hypothetical protein
MTTYTRPEGTNGATSNSDSNPKVDAQNATPKNVDAGATTAPTADSSESPFDPRKLVLSQDFASAIGVKKATRMIPVRKPHRHEWSRVHPTWRLAPVAMIEMKDEGAGELYLVAPEIAHDVPAGEAKAMALFAAINRQNVLFIWPVRIASDGRRDNWADSAMEAALTAQQAWVRVVANMSLGGYEVYESSTEVEPQWPADISSFRQVMEIAFRDQFITTAAHPVLRRLRGEL